MPNLRWMRVLGDTILFIVAVSRVVFIAGLTIGHSYRRAAS